MYSTTTIRFPSCDQSAGNQPPLSTSASILSLFGFPGSITQRSEFVPLRRVEVYAIRVPWWLKCMSSFRDLPSVSSVMSPLATS